MSESTEPREIPFDLRICVGDGVLAPGGQVESKEKMLTISFDEIEYKAPPPLAYLEVEGAKTIKIVPEGDESFLVKKLLLVPNEHVWSYYRARKNRMYSGSEHKVMAYGEDGTPLPGAEDVVAATCPDFFFLLQVLSSHYRVALVIKEGLVQDPKWISTAAVLIGESLKHGWGKSKAEKVRVDLLSCISQGEQDCFLLDDCWVSDSHTVQAPSQKEGLGAYLQEVVVEANGICFRRNSDGLLYGVLVGGKAGAAGRLWTSTSGDSASLPVGLVDLADPGGAARFSTVHARRVCYLAMGENQQGKMLEVDVVFGGSRKLYDPRMRYTGIRLEVTGPHVLLEWDNKGRRRVLVTTRPVRAVLHNSRKEELFSLEIPRGGTSQFDVYYGQERGILVAETYEEFLEHIEERSGLRMKNLGWCLEEAKKFYENTKVMKKC